MKKAILLLLTVILTQTHCFAIPNPESWSKLAQNSQIKEIATVKKITTNKKSKDILYKTVIFKTENSEYIGTCLTKKEGLIKKDRIVGGVYFNPKKGETVYVTITKNGGKITTYQPLNSDNVLRFKTMPDKIKYGVGTAYIED